MRRLGLPQFAFLRGYVNGLPLEELWDRYLYIEGDPHDERLAKRALKEIREAMAQVALRGGKPGTARLLRMHLEIKPSTDGAPRVPTVAEFAEEQGIEDDREEDQIAAWKAVFGDEKNGVERLIQKQLRAIDDLESIAAQSPELGDPVEAWFAPRISARLKANGVMTLYGLASRMARGPSWYAGLTGIGQTKAERLMRWMQENGLRVPQQMQIVPMERMRLRVLAEAGAHRGEGSTLGAESDLDAVRLWLNNYTGNTHIAYRRESERLLLWSASVKRKPLSSLTFEDMQDYFRFLADPQPADLWCAPRSTPRDSPAWRPFEGGLSSASIRRAQAVLAGLFGFLSKQGHLRANPLAGLRQASAPSLRQQFGRRLLSVAQFRLLRDAVNVTASAKQARLGLVLDLFYACGLRLSELSAARFEHLMPLDDGWMLGVIGKGGKYREVPIPSSLVLTAADLARRRGCPCDDGAPQHSQGYLIGLVGSKTLDGVPDPLAGAGVGVISHDIKAHVKKVADALMESSPADAQRIARVSAHWLRHTHASHALEAGVDLAGVQANLGHASLATTSVYASAEQRRRAGQMQKFWVG